MVNIGNDWDAVLADDFASQNYLSLREILKREYKNGTVYPPAADIFNALKFSSYQDTKVVILGQDPYYGEGQAHGLCFSVRPGVPNPPSLQNIFKELSSDLGVSRSNGDLSDWAKQGVLLLNASLTVRAGTPMSHAKIGWETLTDSIITKLNQKQTRVVFVLWGGFARSKKKYITNPTHSIIESAHPSPLSAFNGFFGSKPFSRTNALLLESGQTPVDWATKQ